MGNMVTNKVYLAKVLSVLLIPICILVILINDVFTAQMRMAVALTAGFLIWLAAELTDAAIPALLWPALLIITKAVPATVVYSSYLGTTYFGIAAAFIWVAVLERTKLLQRLCFFIVSKSSGGYLSILIFLFLAGFVVSLVSFATACLVVAIICASFIKSMRIEKTEVAAVIMMTGMLAASTVRMFLYYPLMQGCILSSVQAVDPNFNFGFIELFLYNWPVLLFCLGFIFLMVLLTKKKYMLQEYGKEYFVKAYKDMGEMSRDEKWAAVSIVIVMLLIMSNPITHFDSMLAFVIAMAFLYLPGVNIGQIKDVQSVNMGTLLFFASCMAIGAVCSHVGITAWLTQALVGSLSDVSIKIALILILIIGFILNFAMTPVAMLAGFSGMFYSIFLELGTNPLAAIFAFNHSTDLVLLPYEYVTFLLFFSLGCMTTSQFLKWHALKTILFVAFFAVIILPYWGIVGLI